MVREGAGSTYFAIFLFHSRSRKKKKRGIWKIRPQSKKGKFKVYTMYNILNAYIYQTQFHDVQRLLLVKAVPPDFLLIEIKIF